MRIRTVKPSFFRDEKVARLPSDGARLAFIGLWMEADDAGLFEWNPTELAADLLPFVPASRRGPRLVTYLEALEALGMIRRLNCERHGFISNFSRHQHLSGTGKRSYPVKHDHDGFCSLPAGTREHPRDSAREEEEEGKGRGRQSRSRASGADEEDEMNGEGEVTPKKENDGIPVEEALRQAEKDLNPALQEQLAKRRREREQGEKSTIAQQGG